MKAIFFFAMLLLLLPNSNLAQPASYYATIFSELDSISLSQADSLAQFHPTVNPAFERYVFSKIDSTDAIYSLIGFLAAGELNAMLKADKESRFYTYLSQAHPEAHSPQKIWSNQDNGKVRQLQFENKGTLQFLLQDNNQDGSLDCVIYNLDMGYLGTFIFEEHPLKPISFLIYDLTRREYLGIIELGPEGKENAMYIQAAGIWYQLNPDDFDDYSRMPPDQVHNFATALQDISPAQNIPDSTLDQELSVIGEWIMESYHYQFQLWLLDYRSDYLDYFQLVFPKAKGL